MTPALVENDTMAPPSVNGGPSLSLNFTWTLAGNLTYAASQWGVLVLLARLGTPEMVGQFALGLAITAPIFMFANLSLRTVLATDARQQHPVSDYLGLRLLTSVLALVLVAVVAFSVGYRYETASIVIALGVAKLFESISDLLYGLLQQGERLDCVGRSMILKACATLSAVGIVLSLTRSVFWATLSLAAAWGLVLVWYDFRLALTRDHRPWTAGLLTGWNLRTMSALAWLAIPLGIGMMLNSLTASIPRYFIEHYLGVRELGFFAAVSYIMVAGSQITMAVLQTIFPRLAKHHASGMKSEFRRLVTQSVIVGACVGVSGLALASMFGSEILTILYGSEYARYANLFVWLMLAGAVQLVGGPLSVAVVSMRKFWPTLIINMICILVVAAGCYLLIPNYSLLGAAWAILCSSLLSRLAHWLVLVNSRDFVLPSVKKVEPRVACEVASNR